MFKIKCCTVALSEPWYIENQNGVLLRRDGTLENECISYESMLHSRCFKTEQEAQQFLDKWLPKGNWWNWVNVGKKQEYISAFPKPDGFEIKWLTPKEVKEAAQKGDKEALDCSIEHWKQIVVAGYDEFMEACIEDKVAIDDTYCALCRKFNDFSGGSCNDCLLIQADKECRHWESTFINVALAKNAGKKQEFEKASVDMLNLLIKIRQEKFGWQSLRNIDIASVWSKMNKSRELLNATKLAVDQQQLYREVSKNKKYKIGVDWLTPGEVKEAAMTKDLSYFGYYIPYPIIKGDKEMNKQERQDRLKQVRIDKAALDAEEQKLLKPITHQFRAGDVATINGNPRFIVSYGGKLISIFPSGGYAVTGQRAFEYAPYKYIGRISDFVNEKTVKKFLTNGKVL